MCDQNAEIFVNVVKVTCRERLKSFIKLFLTIEHLEPENQVCVVNKNERTLIGLGAVCSPCGKVNYRLLNQTKPIL